MLDTALAWCASARASLEHVHPILPWLVLTGAIWLTVYGVRRWAPALWLPLTRWPSPDSPASHVLQALPSVVLGAAWAACTSPGASVDVAAWGALSGACAPLVHHALKALPVPYEGPLRTAVHEAVRRWRNARQAPRRPAGLGEQK